MKTEWEYMTRKLTTKEEFELHRWYEENRESVTLIEEGPMEAMYHYYDDGIYRVIVNNIEDAVWFRLKFC